MKLYSVGTIVEKEIEREIVDIQDRKRELEAKLEEMRSLEESLTVKDEHIREVLGNFKRKRSFYDETENGHEPACSDCATLFLDYNTDQPRIWRRCPALRLREVLRQQEGCTQGKKPCYRR